jgi:hypothetical protein
MELTERQIYLKIYYLENKEKLKITSKEFYKKNKEKRNLQNKKYYQENKEKCNAQKKMYRQKNKEQLSAQQKIYRQKNKEKIAEIQKKYQQENKEKINAWKNNYNNSNPVRKLRSRLRSRVRKFFYYKGYKKKNSTEKILGANWKTVESFMEAKFVDGMNWDNIGEWHIDHIIPLSSAETEQETIKLCHYTNLQPLWAFDNLSKGNSLDWVKE